MTCFAKLLPLGLLVALTSPALACQQQEVHPQKTHYQDAQSWPATKPGDVSLKNFRPFRAVYQRNYTQGAGPGAGEPRTDRVIITAEEVGWDGQAAIAITLLDTGDPQYEDTNGRTLSMYVKQEDLSVLFEIGPIPGQGKDYYIGRKLADKMVLNMVTTETGEHQFQPTETRLPGFGPGSWVIANMDLKEGMKIRLDPVYSPPNALTGFANIGYVVGQASYTDLSGTTYEAWMVEHTTNLASASVARRPMIDHPPYLLGTEIVNLDTGEKGDYSIHLIEFEYLGEE